MDNDLLIFTAEIVSAHVANNKVPTPDVADLIASTYAALAKMAAPVEPEALKVEPAVSIKQSIKHDYIVCLEDGAKLKMLKRYLRTNYDMSPQDYRAKWGLPKDYPMVAPAYAEQRRTLAMSFGLGRKKAEELLAEPAAVVPKAAAKRASKSFADNTPDASAKRRGRPPKAKLGIVADRPSENDAEAAES